MMPTTDVRVPHRVGRRSLRSLVKHRRVRQTSAAPVQHSGRDVLGAALPGPLSRGPGSTVERRFVYPR
jgi:hypothetical protein